MVLRQSSEGLLPHRQARCCWLQAPPAVSVRPRALWGILEDLQQGSGGRAPQQPAQHSAVREASTMPAIYYLSYTGILSIMPHVA